MIFGSMSTVKLIEKAEELDKVITGCAGGGQLNMATDFIYEIVDILRLRRRRGDIFGKDASMLEHANFIDDFMPELRGN